ncbi:MAG: hypothetical protein A2142_05270 [candidate division Zixibacteria bacterium RBG_16_48_11]|nr:MAG: hypothetical protein A2142_05270 [candidate division Zixibacteria bacterium RBG_16_48_11]
MPKITSLAEPTQLHERILVIDILRGFALLGILLVNFTGAEIARTGRLDDEVRRLLDFLISSKFYTTFSFLFGLGFALQLLRARQRESRIVPVYLRRMVALYLIGLFHAILIWNGDVLLYYAAMGFLLILFRSLPQKLLLAFVILSLAFEFWTSLPSSPSMKISGLLPSRYTPEMEQQKELDRTLDYEKSREAWQNHTLSTRSGTYVEAVKARFQVWITGRDFLWSYFWATAFAMFLLGLYAGKKGIFHDLVRRQRLLRWTMWTTLPFAFSLNLISAYGPYVLGRFYQQIPDWGFSLLYVLAGPLGSLFYVSALLLLFVKSERWMRRLSFLRWVGRMPLSIYLMQSIIGTMVYYGYGLGMYSRLSYLVGLLLTLAVFALQIPLSRWWLSRFQFGPFEWLWRSLTYGKPQPVLVRRVRPAEPT